jgi:hypothetical protein
VGVEVGGGIHFSARFRYKGIYCGFSRLVSVILNLE